jgi:hypothetical protein
MADSRKSYTVTINGLEHTMLLTPEDAERYGDDAVETKQATPANKSRTVSNK